MPGNKSGYSATLGAGDTSAWLHGREVRSDAVLTVPHQDILDAAVSQVFPDGILEMHTGSPGSVESSRSGGRDGPTRTTDRGP